MADEMTKASAADLVTMERPAYLKQGDVRGTEHIKKADLLLPRLALAQGLTPQVMEQKEGFVPGVLFNSMTEEILGKGPIEFTILRADPPRWIEFYPRTQGGGVKDMNVPAHDPRTQFRQNEQGQSEPPQATMFYDFIIATLPLKPNPMDSVIALSMKSTGLKVARRLNTLMKYRNAPTFAGKYKLTTAVEKNAKGIYAIFVVDNSDIASPCSYVGSKGQLEPGWVDTNTAAACEAMFTALQDRSVTVDRTGAGDPDEGLDVDPVTGEKIPF